MVKIPDTHALYALIPTTRTQNRMRVHILDVETGKLLCNSPAHYNMLQRVMADDTEDVDYGMLCKNCLKSNFGLELLYGKKKI